MPGFYQLTIFNHYIVLPATGELSPIYLKNLKGETFKLATILYINKKKGGGILTYVKNHIKFKIIKDLSVSDDDSKCVTAEIENKNSKKLIIT